MARIRGTGNTTSTNSYEEARRLRLEENKKKIQDLGILNLSKGLSEVKKSVHKSPKPKTLASNQGLDTADVRRSTRVRSSVPSYSEEFNIELPLRPRKRPKSGSWTSYLARPAEEVVFASHKERDYAKQCAETFQSSLQPEYPSFIKSMLRSHVYSCFWLGLPNVFCQNYLPKKDVTMVLEDMEGTEYDSIYKAEKTGLSGGWRGFALDHKLDDGDALVFQLVQPERFKIYVFKASGMHSDKKNVAKKKGSKLNSKKLGKGVKHVSKNDDPSTSKEEET
ncbi:hypothetical protein ACHQM5_025469 [Ranunculus cassubicifolius]